MAELHGLDDQQQHRHDQIPAQQQHRRACAPATTRAAPAAPAGASSRCGAAPPGSPPRQSHRPRRPPVPAGAPARTPPSPPAPPPAPATGTRTDGVTFDRSGTSCSPSGSARARPARRRSRLAIAFSHGALTHGPSTSRSLQSSSRNTVALGSSTPGERLHRGRDQAQRRARDQHDARRPPAPSA